MGVEDGLAVFIMPFRNGEKQNSDRFLREAVNSVINQTDPNWHLVIADSCSEIAGSKELLDEISQLDERITVLHSERDLGPSVMRNKAISYARTVLFASFCLFLDADDIAWPNRLRVTRKRFAENKDVSVIFHPFATIDESSEFIPKNKIAPAIRSIIDNNPNIGFKSPDLWIDMAVNNGYLNLTSTTAVLADLAYRTPFSDYDVSDDFTVWLNYSASGGIFLYTPEILTSYRLAGKFNARRQTRFANEEAYFAEKARVDTNAVKEAFEISSRRNGVSFGKSEFLSIFHLKLCEIMLEEGHEKIALEQMRKYFKNANHQTIKSSRIPIDRID